MQGLKRALAIRDKARGRTTLISTARLRPGVLYDDQVAMAGRNVRFRDLSRRRLGLCHVHI
jgi:hypothetical protein